jgi:hypothetical protein
MPHARESWTELKIAPGYMEITRKWRTFSLVQRLLLSCEFQGLSHSRYMFLRRNMALCEQKIFINCSHPFTARTICRPVNKCYSAWPPGSTVLIDHARPCMTVWPPEGRWSAFRYSTTGTEVARFLPIGLNYRARNEVMIIIEKKNLYKIQTHNCTRFFPSPTGRNIHVSACLVPSRDGCLQIALGIAVLTAFLLIGTRLFVYKFNYFIGLQAGRSGF